MENSTIELSLLEPDEREELEFIWNLIPEEDRVGMTYDDVLFVLDSVDDYLEDVGLLQYDEMSGDAEYLEGEVDETEQLEFVLEAARKDKRTISGVQIQLILDAQYQFYVEQGWIDEDDSDEEENQ